MKADPLVFNGPKAGSLTQRVVVTRRYLLRVRAAVLLTRLACWLAKADLEVVDGDDD